MGCPKEVFEDDSSGPGKHLDELVRTWSRTAYTNRSFFYGFGDVHIGHVIHASAHLFCRLTIHRNFNENSSEQHRPSLLFYCLFFFLRTCGKVTPDTMTNDAAAGASWLSAVCRGGFFTMDTLPAVREERSRIQSRGDFLVLFEFLVQQFEAYVALNNEPLT